MKKFNAIKKSVAIVVAALALTLLGAGVAVADTAANVENDGQDYVGRIVVITDPRPSPATHCGFAWDEYKCVIINPGGGPAIVTTIGIDVFLLGTLSAGDRFTVISQSACNGRLDLTFLED